MPTESIKPTPMHCLLPIFNCLSSKPNSRSNPLDIKNSAMEASDRRSQALRFLHSIRGRSSEEYHQFLQLMLDVKAGIIDVETLAARVKQLFRRHQDLISDFYAFLPAIESIEDEEEEEEEEEEQDPFVVMEEALSFMKCLKASVPKDEYVLIFNSFNMLRYNQISVHDLFCNVADILKDHTSLAARFADFFFPTPLNTSSSSCRLDAGTSTMTSRDLDSHADRDRKRQSHPEEDNGVSSADKPASKVHKEKDFNPSYRLRPVEERGEFASARMELDAPVLNNVFVSEPHTGYDPKVREWSSSEWIAFNVEDDMFEIDRLLELVRAVAEKVEALVKLIEDKAAQSPFCIKQHLSCLDFSCIKPLYGTHWPEVKDGLHKNPRRVLPVIYARLKQKEKEVSKNREELMKTVAKGKLLCF